MRVTVFLGRVHHAIKLLPLVVKLNNAGYNIQFLVANNSINIDPPTEYLHKYGITSFHHAHDYVLKHNLVTQVEAEAISLVMLGDLVPTNAPYWLTSSIREAVYCLHGFSHYLDENKPEIVIALHENNFWVKILFYLARQRGIKTVSLMEGIILEREEEDLGKYSMGTDYTDVLFSWSEYDKKFYADSSTIVPVGPPHLDEWIFATIKDEFGIARQNICAQYGINSGKKIVLFAPPRLDLYKGDIGRAIQALSNYCASSGFEIVLKLHPFQGGADQIKNSFPGLKVFSDDDASPFLFISDIVVTQTSTVSLEALCLGKPVIELDMDYIGLDQPLSSWGAAQLVQGNDLSPIGSLLTDPRDVSEFMGERLPLADGKSADRIVSYLQATKWIS
jgi:hypothetical protein